MECLLMTEYKLCLCLIHLWFVVHVVLHLSLKFKVWLIARSPCTGIIKFGNVKKCKWKKSRYSNRAVTNSKMIVIGYLLLKYKCSVCMHALTFLNLCNTLYRGIHGGLSGVPEPHGHILYDWRYLVKAKPVYQEALRPKTFKLTTQSMFEQ